MISLLPLYEESFAPGGSSVGGVERDGNEGMRIEGMIAIQKSQQE